jgi:hypothetical protein
VLANFGGLVITFLAVGTNHQQVIGWEVNKLIKQRKKSGLIIA